MSLDSIGARSTAWRLVHGLSAEPFAVMAKATEELGEVARALVGDYEGRPGRGDVTQEAAQTIIVLASLVSIHAGRDVMEEVHAEMRRLGA
jgi:NTP pyrophosphatase (non-canonical NTP hydrolase)